MNIRLRVVFAAILALFVTASMLPSQAFASVYRSTYIVQTTAAGQDLVLKSLFGMGEVPLDQLDFVMDGFTVPLTDFEASVLAADPNVVSIEQDQKMSLLETETPTPSWGLDRLDQQNSTLDNSFSYPADPGKGVRIYVVDTGVMASNPDFDGRILPGFDALGQNLQGADCHGHGTHVAGTAAGTKFGIAKAATIVPVRVLDCNGYGYSSSIISGFDWILANNPAGTPAVVSMSIGGGYQPALNAAVKKLYDAGILPVIAAGNSNDDACHYSPSSAPEAFTVGASDANDTRAYFSNFGDCVDIFAPGTNIVSASATNPAGSTTMSGTSMATPHVSGVAALYLAQHPTAKPAEIAQALKDHGILNEINNAQSQFGNILLNDNFVRGAEPVVPNPNPILNAPDQVTSVAVGATTSNSATLTWVDGPSDGGSPVTSHGIVAVPQGSAIGSGFTVNGAGVNSFTVPGLDSNTTYTFTVYARNVIGSGKQSAGVLAKTLIGAPAAPTNLAAIPSSSTAALTWTLTNDGGSPVTSYSIEIFNAANPKWLVAGSTQATGFTLSGLTAATTYLTRVRATNALGTSSPSRTFSFTTAAGVPDVPTQLTSSSITSNSAFVAWQPVTSTSPTTPVTYVISYGIDGATKTQVASSTASAQLTGLSAGRKYTFSVHSQVGTITSAESIIGSFTTLTTAPAVPIAVTVSGNPGSQTLRWAAPYDGGSPILGYVIQSSGPLASTTTTVDVWNKFAEQAATSISLPAAPAGKFVRYRVLARNAAGLSDPSLSIAITTAPLKPGAPTGLSASAPNANGAITLTWVAPANDGGGTITQYTVLISRDGSTWQSLANVTGASNVTFSTSKPTKGQTWLFAVNARNVSGAGPNSDAVSVSTAATVPGPVASESLYLSGTDGILLRWSAPSDNGGAPLTGYLIERQVNGSWSTVAQLAPSILSFASAKPMPGVIVTFRVTAINSLGSGPSSNAISLMAPYVQASSPLNFTATLNKATNKVDVSFTQPSYLGGGTLQSYYVQVSRDGGATWVNALALSASAVSGSLYAPNKGQTYSYRMTATTQYGASLASSAIDVTVASTVPAIPAGFSVILTGSNDVTLHWSAPGDTGGLALTGFTVERLVSGAWVMAAQLPASTLTLIAPRALPGVMNSFRIYATNALGSSAATNPVSVITPYVQASAPQNLSVVFNPTTKRVDVTFAAPSDLGGGAVTYYNLQTSADGGSTWVPSSTIASTAFAFSTNAPAKGKTLSYRMLATTQFGLSLASNSVAVSVSTTVSSAPTNVTSAFKVDGSVQLSWLAPADNGGTSITSYRLQKQVGTTWVDSATLDGSTLTTSVPRDSVATRVTWRLIAVNAVGLSAPSPMVTYVAK